MKRVIDGLKSLEKGHLLFDEDNLIVLMTVTLECVGQYLDS